MAHSYNRNFIRPVTIGNVSLTQLDHVLSVFYLCNCSVFALVSVTDTNTVMNVIFTIKSDCINRIGCVRLRLRVRIYTPDKCAYDIMYM